MRPVFILSVALLIFGCSSSPPEAKVEQRERRPDFSPPEELGDVMAILNQLPRADEPPATEAMAIVMSAGTSPQVHDGVQLMVWHDAERGEVWVGQSGGYPGVDIWFGPGPEALLPGRVEVKPFALARLLRKTPTDLIRGLPSFTHVRGFLTPPSAR